MFSTVMTWDLNNIEFKKVNELPATKRYEHFIKKVADWKEVWMIGDENGLGTYGDDNGEVLIPIWPHEKYAQACCVENFSKYKPEVISLIDWMELWLPDLEKDNQQIAVFPTTENKGIIVEPKMFIRDIQEELSNYE